MLVKIPQYQLLKAICVNVNKHYLCFSMNYRNTIFNTFINLLPIGIWINKEVQAISDQVPEAPLLPSGYTTEYVLRWEL